MIETCETALREAARIINVMRERGVSSAGVQSVITWADATASRGIQQPAPSLGLALLRDCRLVSDAANDSVVCDPRLTPALGAPAQEIERFPQDVVQVVLHGLLSCRELRTEISAVFRYCALGQNDGRVEWRVVPRRARDNPAWLWLQRMGLAIQTDFGLVLHRSLLPYIVDIRHPAIELSQADLDARLLVQRERADLAENFIVEFEKRRLATAGVEYLADAVTRVSIDNVCAGFDVQSFEVSGDPRLIEVKCSAGPRERFFLSDNELETAGANGLSYWLAWVGWGVNLPHGFVDVCWVRDLARALQVAPSPWSVSASGTLVEAQSDDASLRTDP